MTLTPRQLERDDTHRYRHAKRPRRYELWLWMPKCWWRPHTKQAWKWQRKGKYERRKSAEQARGNCWVTDKIEAGVFVARIIGPGESPPQDQPEGWNKPKC